MKKLVLRRETVRLLTPTALETVAGGETEPPLCATYPHTSCGFTIYCRCSEEETYYFGCATWIY